MSRIEVLQGDITKLKADAIINAANNSLLGGGGVDGAIHSAAGTELLEECKTLMGCETGKSKITKGYKLPAKYVIHTVGPVWSGGAENENQYPASCYTTSLEIAKENKLNVIAFPSISTGAFGFPFERASRIAFQNVKNFLDHNSMPGKVIFILISENDFKKFKELI